MAIRMRGFGLLFTLAPGAVRRDGASPVDQLLDDAIPGDGARPLVARFSQRAAARRVGERVEGRGERGSIGIADEAGDLVLNELERAAGIDAVITGLRARNASSVT